MAPALMRTIRPSRPDTLTFRFPTSGCAGEDSDHGEMGRPHRIWMPVTNPSEKLSCSVWHDPMRISMKARANEPINRPNIRPQPHLYRFDLCVFNCSVAGGVHI